MKEIESKYRASRDLVLPDLRGIPGVAEVESPEPTTLVAVYHDTADLRLAREGITLRRRTGGYDDGWHLKLPVLGADPGIRDEIQLPDSAGGVPDKLASIVTAYVRFGRLLRGQAGEPLVEVVDDRVTVEGTGHVSAGFREIEVEDKGGGPSVMSAVGAVLRDAGAVSGTFMPKLVRALGARATAPPDPPLPEALGPKDPAVRVLASYLRTQTRRLLVEDVRFRLGGDDAVHQMRVASRRMRSLLRTCRPILDEEWSEPLRDELKWFSTELGGARDAEVLLARLTADLDGLPDDLVVGPVRTRIESELGARHEAAMAEAEKTLAGDRYLTLLERLVDAAWKPRATETAERPARDVLPSLVKRDWRRLAVGVARVQSTGAAEDYHQVRIASKRLRYAGEALAPAFGKPASRLAAQAERVQEILGEHQDAIVSQETLREIAQTTKGKTAGFTLGVLHAREQSRALAARMLFAEAWPEVRRRRYRDWLAN